MGVVVDGRNSRNNDDPHPARLSFASAVDPPHKGEGRSARQLFCVEHNGMRSNGPARAGLHHPHLLRVGKIAE